MMKTDKQRKPLFVPLELALPPNPSSANTAILAAPNLLSAVWLVEALHI
jgi:hypothetical protein